MAELGVLQCPKCRGDMTSYERGGVVIDQCRDCRGIFLDRGELERLLDLESGLGAPAAPPQFTGEAPDRSWRTQAPQHREWDDREGRGDKKKKSRKSILGDLLDF